MVNFLKKNCGAKQKNDPKRKLEEEQGQGEGELLAYRYNNSE